VNIRRATGHIRVMTDTPPEPPDDTGSPTSEPFADPDPEALADEADEDDLDPDDRTADPDLGTQDAAEVPPGPQNPVEPDDPDVAT
jgi:hypothetical protein